VRNNYRFVFGIGREEKEPAVDPFDLAQQYLIPDSYYSDLSVLHPGLLPDEYERAFQYVLPDHAVAFHFHIKIIAARDFVFRNGNIFGNILVGKDREPRMDASQDRYAYSPF
jgi:hypothetical protein